MFISGHEALFVVVITVLRMKQSWFCPSLSLSLLTSISQPFDSLVLLYFVFTNRIADELLSKSDDELVEAVMLMANVVDINAADFVKTAQQYRGICKVSQSINQSVNQLSFFFLFLSLPLMVRAS
jgi:hypothetical protein